MENELSEETLCRWSLVGDDREYFLSAMSKFYQELNKVGFNDRLGLSRDERIVFNDVCEQLAKINLEKNGD